MSLRIPQLRMVEHLNREDINVGEATIVATKKGDLSGWALPGGKFTTQLTIATTACREAANLIKQNGGLSMPPKRNQAA